MVSLGTTCVDRHVRTRSLRHVGPINGRQTISFGLSAMPLLLLDYEIQDISPQYGAMLACSISLLLTITRSFGGIKNPAKAITIDKSMRPTPVKTPMATEVAPSCVGEGPKTERCSSWLLRLVPCCSSLGDSSEMRLGLPRRQATLPNLFSAMSGKRWTLLLAGKARRHEP